MASTVEIPLKGGKDGVTKGLDGKTVIRAPVDPLIIERAKEYIMYFERAEDAREKANQAGQAILDLFRKMKTQRQAKVISDRRTYVFKPTETYKLLVEKTKTLQN